MTSTPITIVGNLTDDPELRFTPSGAAVVKFSIAVNQQRLNKQTNTWEDAGTDFHRVSAWQYLAQNIAETFTKGMRVVVFGDLAQRHWTDEKTNEKRSAWEVTARAAGPDLKFATAKVNKVKTREGESVGPDDPWATGSKQAPAPAAAGAGRAPGAWPTGQQAGYSDEPPF
jgi:single-strand DNA-binding protein